MKKYSAMAAGVGLVLASVTFSPAAASAAGKSGLVIEGSVKHRDGTAFRVGTPSVWPCLRQLEKRVRTR